MTDPSKIENAESNRQAGRGRLAEVIATRGGLAAPEAPFVIEHREALIYMLCEAAELEHGIMCQYLFAAFSLKQREDEGVSAEQLEAVLRWRKTISHVAAEEMLHLALVHNLLSAIGAAPHLARPNLPAPAHHYPAGVNLTLVPFGEPALRHFMFLERPEGMELTGASGIDAPVHDAVPLMSGRDIVPQLQDFATVGHLYRSIEQGLAHLASKFGEKNLFVGPARAQATSGHFGWPELVSVSDLASAQQAIDTILEQGEGARGDWRHAHFGQFVKILDEYRELVTTHPQFEPARPVIFATVRRCEHDEAVPRIGERVTSLCGDLFNVSYEILLQLLERYFAHTEETDEQLATMANASIALMLGAIRPLGDLLTTLPVGPEHPGKNAGPSFELFYENDYLMPHREAAWALLEERVREAASFCRLIIEVAERPLADQLAPVVQALAGVADSLAAHFPDWGSESRFGAPSSEREPHALLSAEDSSVEEMVEQAEQLAQRVASARLVPTELHPLVALFDRCLHVFQAAAQDSPKEGDASPADAYARRRLLRSVLRPLADAITSETTLAAGNARPSSRVKPDSPSEKTTVVLVDEIWALAQNATTLRAQLTGDTRQEALLLEATAALQHLAIELAPSAESDGREERLAALQSMQSHCEQDIRCAHNGPYLVTNAERMINWLGEALAVEPQLALCRCGESAIKPRCDGACAESGFSDAKDPKRVPDQRDTYDGVQLRVLDNRGICQHSGFCTDRLNNVFHTEGVFVTPSGGRMDEIIRAVRDCPSGALSYAIDGVEARAQVDWDGTREPTIEVTKDGPYRIAGAIPLVEEDGRPVERAAGSSLEHYALCRCGHSQNKPFCSGMHWYVDFRDPVPDPDGTPNLYEWAGGLTALKRVTRLFYEKHVPSDPLLAPLFAEAPPDLPDRLATWVAEVFGHPAAYSSQFGGNTAMLLKHAGRELTEEQRSRWVTLLAQSAVESGLPNDAEFQSTFRSYLEWQSRIAVDASQQDGKSSAEAAMPRWDWNAAGPPRAAKSEQAKEEAPTVVVPGPGEPIQFDQHIKPLFRAHDRQSMRFAFDLWSYDDVSGHADAILDRLRAGSMPCDGAWPKEQVDAFQRWIDAGKPQ